jgi:hypothetical protein
MAYQQAKDIGIIFSVGDKLKLDAIERYVEELEEEGKHIQILAFVSRQADIPPSRIPHFSHHELSFLGEITNENALNFAQKRFDYLLCLDTIPDMYVYQIIAKSQAKIRIGYYSGEAYHAYFDMMIRLAQQKSTAALIEEIKNFTQKLNVNGL